MQALQAGADGVEFDVQLSKDGMPMILHDDNLARVAGDARRVADLTAKELSALQLRGAGNIPSLNDVTTWIPAPAVLDIEIKTHESADSVIAKLKTSATLRERCMVSSFHLEVLRKCQEQIPDVRRLVLIPAWFLPGRNTNKWDDIFALKPWALATRVSYLNKTRISWLRERGVLAAAFESRQSPRAARKMIGLGLDVAITFRADLAR